MNTTLPDKLPFLGLDGIDLKRGKHKSREEGVCVLEARNWLAGEPHDDRSSNADPNIDAFVRGWNDRLRTDADRNRLLKPLLQLLIGTKSTPDIERQRVEMMAKWALGEAVPSILRITGFEDAAKLLEESPTLENAREVRRQTQAARADARKKLFDVVDAVDAVDWRNLTYSQKHEKAREIFNEKVAPRLNDKFAPIKAQLEQGVQDLVKKMCALGSTK